MTDFFKFQNYDGKLFFWICFMNKPDWSISLLTDCLFVVSDMTYTGGDPTHVHATCVHAGKDHSCV